MKQNKPVLDTIKAALARPVRYVSSSVRRKIVAGFALVLALMVGVMAIELDRLASVYAATEEISPHSARLALLQDTRIALSRLEANVEHFALVGGADQREAVADGLRSLRALASGLDGAFDAPLAPLAAALDSLTALEMPAPSARNERLLAVYAALRDAEDAQGTLWQQTQARLADAVQRQRDIIGEIAVLFVAGGVLLLTVAIATAVLLGHGIAEPVAELARAAEQITAGRLASRVTIDSADEVGALAAKFNAMAGRLEDTLVELRRSESNYRGIFANAIEAIWRATIKEGRMLSANPAAARILGYDSPEQLVASITDIGEQVYVDRAARENFIAMVIERGAVLGHEVHWKRRDGSRIWVSISMRLVRDAAGRPDHIEAFGTDVTERHEAQEELRRHRDHLEELVAARTAELSAAKDRAEVASRAKSAFLANMSHELRTPLNSVLGYAQILEHDQRLDDSQRTRASAIRVSGQHLLMLITDLLDLAKIEAGKLELQNAELRLPEFLRSLADFIRVKAEQKHLRFDYQQAGELPAAVIADEKRLRQILLNLLDNAVKFTDSGSVLLRVRPAEGGLRFEVIDSGPGVPAEHRERIFRAFEQMTGTQRRPDGTGLGLAISRQLVRMMGGDIVLDSDPSGGSRFWFEIALPSVAPSEPALERAGHKVGYEGRRRSVLVVDDVPGNRAMLIDVLEPLGFELHEAADGLQALELAEPLQPDLVLMDNVMPVLDGLETTRRLRASGTLRDVPIIAISAAAAESDRRSSLAAGASEFMTKPVDVDTLIERIGSLLRLRWITAADAGAEPAVAVQAPTIDQLETLYRLALTGNMRAIREHAARLAAMDSSWQAFGQHLCRLAERFESRAIVEFVRRWRDEAGKGAR